MNGTYLVVPEKSILRGGNRELLASDNGCWGSRRSPQPTLNTHAR